MPRRLDGYPAVAVVYERDDVKEARSGVRIWKLEAIINAVLVESETQYKESTGSGRLSFVLHRSRPLL